MTDSWKKTAAIFLTGQTLSLLGSSLVQYALMWYVTLESGSGVMMTIYVAAGFVPTFLLSPLAGVWADRYDRKRLIVLADGGIALVTLIMALAFSVYGESLWLIFVAAAFRAVGQAVHQPAVGAILPQFVPEDQLMRVNGIYGTIQSVNMLASPVLAGLLMSLMPLQGIFLIDVGTATLAILLIQFFLKVPPHARAGEVPTTTHWQDLLEGFRYIRSHKYLVPFFSFLAVILILITPAAMLTPLQTARTYGKEVWRLTGIEMTFSIGMMAGGGLLALWGGFKNRMHSMAFSTILMALCTIGLGLAPEFWLYLTAMGVFGVALAFYNTPSMVILQEHVEPEFLGRMMSVSTMLFTSLFPLSMVFFGPLAESVSIEAILLVTGALVLAVSLGAFLYKPLMLAGLPPEKQSGLSEQAGS